jgi:hypothetical protein
MPACSRISGLVKSAAMKKCQCRKRRVGFYDNISSTPAVAPIGTAEGYELGAPEGDGSVSPVSRPDLYGYLIQHELSNLNRYYSISNSIFKISVSIRNSS